MIVLTTIHLFILVHLTYSTFLWTLILFLFFCLLNTGAVGLWVCLFIYSKFPELLDTAFLVIQRKKVIFLHWFHHTTVLMYCWHAYHNTVSQGIWFAAMSKYFFLSFFCLVFFFSSLCYPHSLSHTSHTHTHTHTHTPLFSFH